MEKCRGGVYNVAVVLRDRVMTEPTALSAASTLETAAASVQENVKTWFKPTTAQDEVFRLINTADILALIGEAGTGKTSAAIRAAISLLKANRAEEIVLCRAAVTFGEDIGFLPGDMRDKLSPFIAPVGDALKYLQNKNETKKVLKEAIVIPVGHLQGRTIQDAVAIVDEAQNLRWEQLEMVVTRLGRNGKIILCGDPTQPAIRDSGYVPFCEHVIRKLSFARIINFPAEEAVRHYKTKELLAAIQQGRIDRKKADG